MSSSESERDTKKMEREPLCLFCYPWDPSESACDEEPYVAGRREDTFGKAKSEKFNRRKWSVKKGKQEMWLRRRKEMSLKRRRKAFEAGRHLKSYLFMSVRPTSEQQNLYIPCLIEALDTVKDAWAPNKLLSTQRYLAEDETVGERVGREAARAMMEDEAFAQVSFCRRSSMPEEFMRKYLLRKSTASEESETNQSVADVSVADKCSEAVTKGTANWNEPPIGDKRRENYWNGESVEAACEEVLSEKKGLGNVGNEVRRLMCHGGEASLGQGKRAVQNEFDKQGKGIIKVKSKERGSQTGRCSESSPTARNATEESHTSESLASSSPVELPRRHTPEDISTSGNLSSESEDFLCTCAEITSSKDTSTDLFRSGNSTLSQTVSEKSTSTQDSTVSIHSVSTGGSTVSANSNSNSSTPDVFAKTSAKESTSPEETPKPRGGRGKENFVRSKRNLRHTFGKRCGKFGRRRPYCRWHFRSKRCISLGETIEEKELKDCCSVQENSKGEAPAGETEEGKALCEAQEAARGDEDVALPEPKYKWTKYTSEEIYMMQQMRHRKFVENCRRFSIPLAATPDTGSLGACATSGSAYKEQEDVEERVLIPRYSALPRTLSMLVNTSSGDASAINSDSDSLSLADSLEEFPVVHVHQISYDTKKEQKPVRGDVNAAPEAAKTVRRRHPRPKAFFVSIKEPYGEDELLSGITKIPEPPDKIKDRINKRQLYILSLQRRNSERRKEDGKWEAGRRQKKYLKDKSDGRMRTRMNLKTRSIKESSKRKEIEGKGDANERQMPREALDGTGKQKEGKAGQQIQSGSSKIPVAVVSSTSTSTSPERESIQGHRKKKTKKGKRSEMKCESDVNRGGRARVTTSKASEQQPEVGRGADEEAAGQRVSHSESSGATKPQAVIHPSPAPASEPELTRRNRHFVVSQVRALKFRQKFEAIPEEKSSSLSSTEEKKGRKASRASLPVKLVPPPLSPTGAHSTAASESERSAVRRYSLGSGRNLIFAKFAGKSLQEPPRGPSVEQPIILLSPKEIRERENSRKGRDTLIAMNREDFNRLSKGWMNFYMLKETSDASESSVQGEEKEEGKTRSDGGHAMSKGREGERSGRGETADEKSKYTRIQKAELRRKCQGGTKTSGFVVKEEPEDDELTCPNRREERRKEKGWERGMEGGGEVGREILSDCLRFHTSNTILKPIQGVARVPEKRLSLPELNLSLSSAPCGDQHAKDKRSTLVLPRVSQKTVDYDEVDSDSTVYCQPPSFIVPRLTFDGSGDFPSEGSISGSNSESEEIERKTVSLPVKYVPLRKRGTSQRVRHKREGNAEAPKRGGQGCSGWSVTVAGTVELTTATPDLEMRLSFPVNGCGPPQASQSDSGFAEEGSLNIEPSSRADERGTLKSNGNMKQRWTVTVQNPKEGDGEGIRRKFGKSNVLPSLGQPQPRTNLKVVKSRKLADNENGCSGKISIYYPKVEITKDEWIDVVKGEELSVRGAAVAMEKKPRAPTMTERDVTKGLTARSGQSDSKCGRRSGRGGCASPRSVQSINLT